MDYIASINNQNVDNADRLLILYHAARSIFQHYTPDLQRWITRTFYNNRHYEAFHVPFRTIYNMGTTRGKRGGSQMYATMYLYYGFLPVNNHKRHLKFELARRAVAYPHRKGSFEYNLLCKFEEEKQQNIVRDLVEHKLISGYTPNIKVYDTYQLDKMLRTRVDLPILADFLEEQGLEDQIILAHCRAPMSHCEDCWIIRVLNQYLRR